VLEPYRVLDLTDERGHLAGFLLASLGADVIAIEPPEGSRARRLGPFVDDLEGPERSLTHFAYNRGKRSVVLELDDAEGRARLLALAVRADVVLESAGPGVMAARGLGPDDLARVNPRLVTVSISAFGSDGPKADWPVTDLTLLASTFGLYLNGDADRAPVRVSVPQAFHFGAVNAVGGALVALLERGRSGAGQHVDVSAQQGAMLATQAGFLATAVGSVPATRSAGGAQVGPMRLRFVYPTKDDGFVSITHVFGPALGPCTARLMDWAAELGLCSRELADQDWVNYVELVDSGEVPIERWEESKAAVERLTLAHTKAELFAEAMKRRLLLAPIATPLDVLSNEQYLARGLFETVAHPEAGRDVMAPGAFVQCSATPLRPLGRAPRLGEHTEEVLGALGEDDGPGVEGRADAGLGVAGLGGRGPALEGLKVLDFTWSIAGPHSVRVLADCGATVVKVESSSKRDAARGYRPCANDVSTPDSSTLFDDMAAGKLSLALDLNRPEARDVVLDLVRWADVVIESFSPRAMKGWRLDYEHLREVNPGVVMVSTCLLGQTGPLASFAGYGNLAAAMAGFYGLAGWPDRPPAGPFGAYTDYTSTHLVLCAILAAVDHQRRTGVGQHLDLAQAEAAMQFLAPAVLDASLHGRVPERVGNADAGMAPHGVYPVLGEDRWLALACGNDANWRALCRLMGRDDLLRDEALATAAGRLARRAELDAVVARWTAGQSAGELEAALIEAGVPAHRVADGGECIEDAQLRHRGHVVELEHEERRCVVEATRFQLRATPAGPSRRAPTLGEHTDEVLREYAGYDHARIAALHEAGVLR